MSRLLANIRTAIEFCQADDLGSAGKTVRWGKFYVKKLSSTRYEIIADWGITYRVDQHGNFISQSGDGTETDSEFGKTAMAVLLAIAGESDPIRAHEAVMNLPATLGITKNSVRYKIAKLLKSEHIDPIKYDPPFAGASSFYGYRLTEKGIHLLKKVAQKDNRK
jgi:hypothetical protein